MGSEFFPPEFWEHGFHDSVKVLLMSGGNCRCFLHESGVYGVHACMLNAHVLICMNVLVQESHTHCREYEPEDLRKMRA